MIILITGASHTGKTLLAQRLLEKLKYPYLSIDHLKMGLIRSGNTTLTPQDDYALKDYLWPIVREIIKTAVENKQNLIVEGCYVPPDWRNDFDARYLPFIRFICLAMTEDYIGEHFDEIIGHESEIESRLVEADCTIDGLKKCNRWFIDAFRSAGEQVTLIEGDHSEALTDLIEKTADDLKNGIIADCGADDLNNKIIAACGNDCAACPRYTAHPFEKSENELRHTAELWMKIGYRDHIVTNGEIACAGCRPENQCRYNVVNCCAEKGLKTCAECADYPCERMKECFRITQSFEPMCREVCTDEEYEQMKKAFFEKEYNLSRL